jgi:biotin carboxyl carrier protein
MNDIAKPYKVKTNDFIFYFDKTDMDDLDLIKTSATGYNLVKDHRSVNAKMVEADIAGKKISIEIAGEIFVVEIRDELDQALEQMGFGLAAKKQVMNIKAPMPGLVLEIAVEVGQDVILGDKIMILEAMKMENSILAISNSRIKKIIIEKGQAVEKGQVLVEFE